MTIERKKYDLPLRIACMVMMVVAVLGIVVRSAYGGGFISRLLVLTGLREEESVVSDYLFTGESFAMAGDKLAVASSVGAQLIDESGTTLSAERFAMDVPAVSTSDSVSLFYDVGGTALCVITEDGESILSASENPIRFGDVSEDGYITLVTEMPAYRGQVSVYSSSFSPVFTLNCGVSGYPLTARVSPSGHLVINCVGSMGSVLRFYSLKSEKELACYEEDERLILDFDFMQDGCLAALTEEALCFLDDTGHMLSTVEFDDMVLSDYCLTGHSVLVLLHSDLTGSKGVLRSYNRRGELIGELELDRSVYSLSTLGKQVLVLYPSELTLYHEDFSSDISYQRVANSTLCLMAAEDKALLLGRSGAELIRFHS